MSSEKSLYYFFKHYTEPGHPQYVAQIPGRILPDFPIEQDRLRQMTWNEWREHGFNRWQQLGWATTLADGEEHAVVAQIKTAVISPYDTVVISVPHELRDSGEIRHLPHRMNQADVGMFYRQLGRVMEIHQTLAAEQNKRLLRHYIIHHVGFWEDHDLHFNISFPHFHMHVTGITEDDVQRAEKITSAHQLRDSRNRFLFQDPTSLLVNDYLKHSNLGDFHWNRRLSSFELGTMLTTHPDLGVFQDQLMRLYHAWEVQSQILALNFTWLDQDDHGISVPNDTETNLEMIGHYLDRRSYFTEDSRELLRTLAARIQPFDSERLDHAVYQGPAGSLGWTVNYEQQTTTLRWGPRFLASANKDSATDGFFMGVKDKRFFMEDASEQVLTHQQVIRRLSEEASEFKVNNNVFNSQILLSLPVRTHNAWVREDSDWVYKLRNRYPWHLIAHEYVALREAGIDIGPPPIFGTDENGAVIQQQRRLYGDNGAEFLARCSREEALAFYKHVIAKNIHHLFLGLQENGRLPVSIDAIPHNFVWDPEALKFVYIDYEPTEMNQAHAHFREPTRLVWYATAKFGRERPDLWPEILDEASQSFTPEVNDFIGNHAAHRLLRTNRDEIIDVPVFKDDILGYWLSWATRASDQDLSLIRDRLLLADKFGNVSWKQERTAFMRQFAYEVIRNSPKSVAELVTIV